VIVEQELEDEYAVDSAASALAPRLAATVLLYAAMSAALCC
jgi:hypothetical protein